MLEAQLPLSLETQTKHPHPCKAMEKIYYNYEEPDITGDWEGTGKFAMSVYFFDPRYKEISQSRYYDILFQSIQAMLVPNNISNSIQYLPTLFK